MVAKTAQACYTHGVSRVHAADLLQQQLHSVHAALPSCVVQRGQAGLQKRGTMCKAAAYMSKQRRWKDSCGGVRSYANWFLYVQMVLSYMHDL